MSETKDLSDHLKMLNAIVQDNGPEVFLLLSKHRNLLEYDETSGAENLLPTACKHRSHHVAEEIVKRKPELAGMQDQDGQTPLHFASANGDVSITKILTDSYPQACLIPNNLTMLPLHLAGIKGYIDLIRVLVRAAPESLERYTSEGQTALHLTLKNNQCSAFEILIEEIHKYKLDLMNLKDHEGNTILHIAISKKLYSIVKLLLLDSMNCGTVMDVNAKNNQNITALDIYYGNSVRDTATIEIGHILFEAGAVEGSALTHPSASFSRRSRLQQSPLNLNRRSLAIEWPPEMRNVLLVIPVMVVFIAFTVIGNLHGGYVDHAPFSVKEVISARLPSSFYIIMVITAALLLSLGIIIASTWSLPFGKVVFFVVIMIFIVYALGVKENMPKFLVRIGSCDISGSWLVWLTSIILSFIGGATAFSLEIMSSLNI